MENSVPRCMSVIAPPPGMMVSPSLIQGSMGTPVVIGASGLARATISYQCAGPRVMALPTTMGS
jgi:hypothetical protein